MSTKSNVAALAANANLEVPAAPSLEALMERSLAIMEEVAKNVAENLSVTKAVATGVASLIETKLSGAALAADKKVYAELRRKFGTDRFAWTYVQWVKAGRPMAPLEG